jgi:hypothetical protein
MNKKKNVMKIRKRILHIVLCPRTISTDPILKDVSGTECV